MADSAPKKKARVSASEGYKKLLLQLDPYAERAEEKYSLLRLKLIVWFESRVGPSSIPEDLADDTIDRVAQKLDEGEGIRDLWAYCGGVAKNVVSEHWRDLKREAISLDDASPGKEPFIDPSEQERRESEKWQWEHKYECWESCLQELPFESRQLFIWYHQQEKHSKQIRDMAAGQLGISRDALYIKICRIRKRLEACCINCLAQKVKEI